MNTKYFYYIILIVAVALSGVAFSLTAPQSASDNEFFACYEFDELLYMNPLSSFIADKANMPYVYGLNRDSFIEANTVSGDIVRYVAQYEMTPVNENEFLLDVGLASIFLPPDISRYKERYLRAVLSDGYRLYQMDGELWLVRISEKAGLWSVYRLKKTGGTTLDDLERALALQESKPSRAPSPEINDDQMTLKDLYALARKGGALTMRDFEPFAYKLTGSDFTIMRFDAEGANVVTIRTGFDGAELESVRLMSLRTLDESNSIDLREGFKAVAAYLNPLGGEFTALNHLYTFMLDGEAFYPSKSFMYVVWDSNIAVYFDIEELADFFEWYGWDGEAETLRHINNVSDLPVIAGRTYIPDTDLVEIGIGTNIGWVFSSHTPVNFTTIK